MKKEMDLYEEVVDYISDKGICTLAKLLEISLRGKQSLPEALEYLGKFGYPKELSINLALIAGKEYTESMIAVLEANIDKSFEKRPVSPILFKVFVNLLSQLKDCDLQEIEAGIFIFRDSVESSRFDYYFNSECKPSENARRILKRINRDGWVKER